MSMCCRVWIFFKCLVWHYSLFHPQHKFPVSLSESRCPGALAGFLGDTYIWDNPVHTKKVQKTEDNAGITQNNLLIQANGNLWHWCCSGRGASKILGLYRVHSGPPQPILHTLWPLSDCWGVKHWCQCNIRANKAVFYQFRVTKLKNFSLHSSLAFITVKWKNAYRVVQQAVTSASKAMAHTSKFPYCTALLFKII